MSEDTRRKLLAGRVPPDVHAEFLKLREATGKSESALVNEAIAAYLGIAAAMTVPDRLSQVETTLEELKQQVGHILGKFRRLATR
jgi:predicted DNA-binding protein